MTVVNHGRRPTVVLEAGIATGVHQVPLGNMRRRVPHIGAEMGNRRLESFRDAGAMAGLAMDLQRQGCEAPPADALPFVRDSHGRYLCHRAHARSSVDRLCVMNTERER
jgi:hypothetical protein